MAVQYFRVSSSPTNAEVYAAANDQATLTSLLSPGNKIEQITFNEFSCATEPHEPEEFNNWANPVERPGAPQTVTSGIEDALRVQPSPSAATHKAEGEFEPHFGARDLPLD